MAGFAGENEKERVVSNENVFFTCLLGSFLL